MEQIPRALSIKDEHQGGNIRVAPEDGVAPADRSELDDESIDEESSETGFAVRMSVIAERPGKGALAVEAVADSGEIMIEDIYFFPKGEHANPKTAEKDWQRKSLYTGPPFDNLDEDLRVLLERWLDERGINTSLALFVPDYIDFKEQKEYLNFLSSGSN